MHSLDLKCCSPGWPTIIDTGADLTVVPTAVAAHLQINVAKQERTKLKFAGRAPDFVPVLFLEIEHPDFGRLQPVKAAFMDRNTILLGRDCLKQFLFMLHGPKGQFIVHQNRSWWVLHMLRFMPDRVRRQMRPPEIK